MGVAFIPTSSTLPLVSIYGLLELIWATQVLHMALIRVNVFCVPEIEKTVHFRYILNKIIIVSFAILGIFIF